MTIQMEMATEQAVLPCSTWWFTACDTARNFCVLRLNKYLFLSGIVLSCCLLVVFLFDCLI